MSTENSSQRERNKEKLRKNVLDGQGRRIAMPGYIRQYRKYIASALGMAAAFAALLLICLFIYNRFRTFRTYQVNWQTQISSPSSVSFIGLGKNVAAVGRDGITCYDRKGEDIWTFPYDMKNPVSVKQGGYLLIYDLNGQSMIICNENGVTGSVSVSYPISSADISAGGVTAAVLEDSRASLIRYFQKDGKQLDIEIQSPLASGGYPLDISISPGGQQLMVSYYCIENGAGVCRVDFYDFEKGKDRADRIVGSFSYAQDDTYIPLTVYSSNDNAFAVGDNQILFYSAEKRTEITQSAVPVDGEIQKVFYDDSYLGLVIVRDEGVMLEVYDTEGKQLGEMEQESIYESYCFSGREIVMYSPGHCRIVTMRGRERFDLEFENEICSLVPADGKKSFYLGTLDVLQKITLK